MASRALPSALGTITLAVPRAGEELLLGAASGPGDCAWPRRWWGSCFPPCQHPLLGFLWAPSGCEGASGI